MDRVQSTKSITNVKFTIKESSVRNLRDVNISLEVSKDIFYIVISTRFLWETSHVRLMGCFSYQGSFMTVMVVIDVQIVTVILLAKLPRT